MLWVYDGWADVSFVGGEVKDPEKNLPRVLIAGTLIIIALYLLANLAYLAVLPVEEIRHSKLVAADVADKLVGAAGVAFVSVAVMISTFGTLNGSVMTGSRVLFAMADDGLLFKPIASVDQKFQTPSVAIALERGLGVVFVLLGTFEQLADTFVTAIVPFYALAVGSVFVFRRRPDYHPPFRVPGYPVVPAIFIRRHDTSSRERDNRPDQPDPDARGPGRNPPRNPDFLPLERQAERQTAVKKRRASDVVAEW